MNKWLILFVMSLFYFFATASTFTSLGVVLYTMVADLGWSQTEAGLSFSILGLFCGITSLIPALLIKRIGTRLTVVAGALIMACGFALAARVSVFHVFLAATAMMGGGFTLVANVPAMNLINNWFVRRREQALGLYLLCGGLGGVAGPLLVGHIVTASGSWHVYWNIVALAALALALIAFFTLREHPASAEAPQTTDTDGHVYRTGQDWSGKAALRTCQFYVLALAMTVTLFCTLTVNSATVMHLAGRGILPQIAIFALGMQALASTVVKGISGWVGARIEPKLLLIAGLALQMAGMATLGFASTDTAAYLFAVLFGCGWGIVFFAVPMLLVNYFGTRDNPILLSTLQLITTAAMIGPTMAGVIADKVGTFAPAFYIFALMLAGLVITTFVMKPPVPRVAPALEPVDTR